jgi:hypothetical protein
MNQNTPKSITGKLSGLLKQIVTRLQLEWQEIRMQYVLGLSRERFAWAEFYINGRKDNRTAKSFDEVLKMVRHFEKMYHLKQLSEFMLLRMWCSRRTFQIKSKDVQIDVLTFWHF